MGGRKRKGISFGTVISVLLTGVVIAGLLVVLPKLIGDTTLHINAKAGVVTFDTAGLPHLERNEIPIAPGTASTAVPSQTPNPTAPPEVLPESAPEPSQILRQASLTIGGSVLVQTEVRRSCYLSDSETYDFSQVLPLIAPYLQADISVVPMENLIHAKTKYGKVVTPEDVMGMMASAGVDVVPLGFPEVLDNNWEAVRQTVDALQARSIAVTGVSFADTGMTNPVTLTANGIKFTLLHYTEKLTDTGRKRQNKEEGSAIAIFDEAQAAKDIAQARANGAEVVVVTMDWAKNNSTKVVKSQTEIAQMLANAGADVIVGKGTNTVQPVVWLDKPDGTKALCAYSLGCLISDSREAVNLAGMLLHLTFEADGTGQATLSSASYTPTYVWRYRQDSQYHYRVVPSHLAPPDGMNEEQSKQMQKAFQRVEGLMADSPVSLAK